MLASSRLLSSSLVLSAGLVGFQVIAASAHDLVAVLPPDDSLPVEATVQDLAYAIDRLGPNDEITIYSATGPTVVGHIAPTHDPRAANPAWRHGQLAAQFAPVLDYLKSRQPTAPGAIPGNLMIPQVLAEIGRNLTPALASHKADVLLLGSWLYADPRDARFAVLNLAYPSDGHLKADEGQTPFGLAGNETRLAGLTVHFCGVGRDREFQTSDYEAAVKRFWTLYVTGQSGRVGTFSRSLATCVERWVAGEASGQASFAPSASTKIEMLRARSPDGDAIPASTDVPGAYFLKDGVVISHEPPSQPTGVAWVGIRWDADCDLDLYAHGANGKKWLFFGNPQSDEGYFDHDFQSATGGQQFEYIAFQQPIDFRKAEVAINIYAGNLSTPPSGVIRVWAEGKIYEMPFQLSATRGDGGAMPMTGKTWLRVDLKKLLGLPD